MKNLNLRRLAAAIIICIGLTSLTSCEQEQIYNMEGEWIRFPHNDPCTQEILEFDNLGNVIHYGPSCNGINAFFRDTYDYHVDGVVIYFDNEYKYTIKTKNGVLVLSSNINDNDIWNTIWYKM